MDYLEGMDSVPEEQVQYALVGMMVDDAAKAYFNGEVEDTTGDLRLVRCRHPELLLSYVRGHREFLPAGLVGLVETNNY